MSSHGASSHGPGTGSTQYHAPQPSAYSNANAMVGANNYSLAAVSNTGASSLQAQQAGRNAAAPAFRANAGAQYGQRLMQSNALDGGGAGGGGGGGDGGAGFGRHRF